MREPILAANWKMHKTIAEAVRFVEDFLPRVTDVEGVEIVLAPPHPCLERVAQALQGSAVRLAAQNVHPEPQGAFTGEVSVPMLADVGCTYTIVGHSERRAIFGETDAFIAQKVAALLARGIRPIMCVGESLAQREAGKTFTVVETQLEGGLQGLEAPQAGELVVAYEPVWAIGTGRTATPEMAQEVHGFIRQQLEKRFGVEAGRVRIQYGGSVKPGNVYELMAQPDVDGALVGGASLDPESFARIVHFQPVEESS